MSGNSSLCRLNGTNVFVMHVMAGNSIFSKEGNECNKSKATSYTLTPIAQVGSQVNQGACTIAPLYSCQVHTFILFGFSTALQQILSMSQSPVFVSYYSCFSENWGYVQSIILWQVILKYMRTWALLILLLKMTGKSLTIKLFVSAATGTTSANRHQLNISAYRAMSQLNKAQAASNRGKHCQNDSWGIGHIDIYFLGVADMLSDSTSMLLQISVHFLYTYVDARTWTLKKPPTSELNVSV